METGEAINALQSRIGHEFRDRNLLVAALTHSSFCNESRDPVEDNERLEFLGDAIVSTAIAAAAFEAFPASREGDLTRLKAALVSEPSLAERARELGLGELLRVGRGAGHGDRVGGLPRVLADAFEALVGAVYLDAGFEVARALVLAQLGPALAAWKPDGRPRDAKSRLQEACLASSHATPRYRVLSAAGPSHEPCFEVEVNLPDGRTFPGVGRSKKDAEQVAAAAALTALEDP